MEIVAESVWIPSASVREGAVLTAIERVDALVSNLTRRGRVAYRDGLDAQSLVDRAVSYNWVIALENHGSTNPASKREPGYGAHFVANCSLDFAWMLRKMIGQDTPAETIGVLVSVFRATMLMQLRADLSEEPSEKDQPAA